MAVGGELGINVIMHTSDGGATWNSVISGHSFARIFFVDAHTGHFLSTDQTGAGTLYKTTDGGTTWVSDPTPQQALRGMFFLDPDNGYAVGNGGVILHYSTASGMNTPSISDNGITTFSRGNIVIIQFHLATVEAVSLSLYNLNGVELQTSGIRTFTKGTHQYAFEQPTLPVGYYLATLKTKSGIRTAKILVGE